jgi:DNA replication protein DnaC
MATNSISLESPACALCGGTGWRTVSTPESKGKAVARCDCAMAKMVGTRMRLAHIPSQYADCSFESFVPYGPDRVLLERAKIDARHFAEHFPLMLQKSLLLVGSIGTGKTHLAVAVLKSLISAGHSARFYEYRELLKDIQSTYNKDAQCSEVELLRPVMEVPVLVLDELGAVKPTEWVFDTVGLILNTRYNENLPTILTTNYANKTAGSARGELTLGDRVGDRMHSRLNQMCRVIEMYGADFRRRGAK